MIDLLPSLPSPSIYQGLGFPDFGEAVIPNCPAHPCEGPSNTLPWPPQWPSSWPQPSCPGSCLERSPLKSHPWASHKDFSCTMLVFWLPRPHPLTSQRPPAHSPFFCSVNPLLASLPPSLHYKVEHLKASSLVRVRNEKCRGLGPGWWLWRRKEEGRFEICD